MSKRTAVGAGVTAALVAIALGTLAAQAPAFKRTVLQQVDLSVPGREAVMALAEFPASSETGRHTHPGEEISSWSSARSSSRSKASRPAR